MSAIAASDVPYGIIATCFLERTVVPFLGSAASFVGAPAGIALPDAASLAKRLATRYGYPGSPSDALTKITQFLEEVPADRPFLLSQVQSLFHDHLSLEYSNSCMDFLGSIPRSAVPNLFITTNYDVLLERAFDRLNIPYLAIAHILRGSKYTGRLLCYDSLTSPVTESEILTPTELRDRLAEVDDERPDSVLIYKIHGTSRLQSKDGFLDSIVLTENDYTDFLALKIDDKIPARILKILWASRLLFLGYSLEDWNFRVMLRRIQLLLRREQQAQKRHWACLLKADDVEVKFWDRRGVNLYSESLDVFLSTLADAICEQIP